MLTRIGFFLILIVSLGISPSLAQKVQFEYAKEKTDRSRDSDAHSVDKIAQNKFVVDSLRGIDLRPLSSLKDSLNSLSSQSQNELRVKIDSLRGISDNRLRLNDLNQNIDSLLDDEILNHITNNYYENLEKLSIPEIPSLNNKKLEISDLTGGDAGVSSLISHVDQQLGKVDELKNSINIKNTLSGYQQIPGEFRQYGEVLNEPSQIDEIVNAQALKLNEFQSIDSKAKELIAIKQLPESYRTETQKYQDISNYRDEAKEFATKQASEYIYKNQDKIEGAHVKMTKLKKKFSKVPDSRDLGTAVKASSLKDEPMRKRFVLGMGMKFQQTNPISLDLAPNIMYRINSMFSVGISGTYRVVLGIENNKARKQNTLTDVYGASVFAQHEVWKGFFAHAEFEYLNAPIKDLNAGTDFVSRKWSEGALLGIGKMINLSKSLKGQVVFVYDFLHDRHSPNPKAWTIKFGFHFGRLKLKDFNL